MGRTEAKSGLVAKRPMATTSGASLPRDVSVFRSLVPAKLVPGMGGAMDLVVGAKRVIVAMQHAARGKPKIVAALTLPPTAIRRVSLIVTEMAVIEPTSEGLLLRERAPGVSVEDIVAQTGADLLIIGEVPEMPVAIPDRDAA